MFAALCDPGAVPGVLSEATSERRSQGNATGAAPGRCRTLLKSDCFSPIYLVPAAQFDDVLARRQVFRA